MRHINANNARLNMAGFIVFPDDRLERVHKAGLADIALRQGNTVAACEQGSSKKSVIHMSDLMPGLLPAINLLPTFHPVP